MRRDKAAIPTRRQRHRLLRPPLRFLPNLTATGGNQQVSLAWTASTGATSYNVKRATTNGGPYTTVASPAGTSYTDTNVTNGTAYYYVVTAVNATGQSGNSNQATATPAAAPTAPVPPLTSRPREATDESRLRGRAAPAQPGTTSNGQPPTADPTQQWRRLRAQVIPTRP